MIIIIITREPDDIASGIIFFHLFFVRFRLPQPPAGNFIDARDQ